MTSCSGHYQAYVKVAASNEVCLNNNGQINHLDNCQRRNEGSVDSDIESPGENKRYTLANGTLADKKTNHSDEKASEIKDSRAKDESDISSPESSAEKATATCIPGITRYFNRTKKYSKLENSKDVEDGLPYGDLTGGIRCRRHSTPSYNFKGISKSLNKIQSFHHGSAVSSRNAIRQLNFQESNKPGNNENNGPVCVKQTPCTCVHGPDTGYQWIHFDDAEVAILDEPDVMALLSSSESSFTSPYLLFYKLWEP